MFVHPAQPSEAECTTLLTLAINTGGIMELPQTADVYMEGKVRRSNRAIGNTRRVVMTMTGSCKCEGMLRRVMHSCGDINLATNHRRCKVHPRYCHSCRRPRQVCIRLGADPDQFTGRTVETWCRTHRSGSTGSRLSVTADRHRSRSGVKTRHNPGRDLRRLV